MSNAGEPGGSPSTLFGKWLDQQLTATKMDQSQLAREVEVKPGYISMLRSGAKTSPSERVIEAIARAFARHRRLPADALLEEAFQAAGQERAEVSLIAESGLIETGKQLLAIRPLEYLLDREADAQEIWIVRSNTFFLSGFPGHTRKKMLTLLEEDSSRHFFFLFRDDQKREDVPSNLPEDEKLKWSLRQSDNPPRDSFAHFKKAAKARDDSTSTPAAAPLFERVHGYGVKTADEMLALGLGMTYAATVILIYKDDAAERLKRDHDIFSEMYIAAYEDVHTRRDDDGYLAWIEIPPRRAQTLWTSWEPILERVRQSVSERTDFLATRQKADDYIPGVIVVS